MTTDELEGIALRHAENERWLPSRLRADLSALAGSLLMAHENRGALLAFVRRIAESNPIADAPGGGEGCIHCWRKPDDHAEDCIWRIAQGARS